MALDEMIVALCLFLEQQDQIQVFAGRQAAQLVSMEFLLFSVPTGDQT